VGPQAARGMWGRSRKKDAAASQPPPAVHAAAAEAAQASARSPGVVVPAGGVATPKSEPRGGGTAPSAAEFAQLSGLLQQKCDENDDLSHNLRLAKDSLRHLSEELDEKSETAEQLREENQRLQQDKSILEEEVATLRAAMQSKDAVSAELQRRMAAFQAALEQRETGLRAEVERLKRALHANEMELEQRNRRINRLTSSVDDMEEGVAVGRVHIKKLTALLSKPPHVHKVCAIVWVWWALPAPLCPRPGRALRPSALAHTRDKKMRTHTHAASEREFSKGTPFCVPSLYF